MFTNATVLSLLAEARRADDLRPRHARPLRAHSNGGAPWLARLVRRPQADHLSPTREPGAIVRAPAS